MHLAHELFERNASAQPDAVAVRFRERELTYAELNERANRLAHALLARSIGRGDRVVVCVEPGLEVAICLLAILKVGAVYVPFDPGFPEARLQAMLQDTAPVLMLKTRGVAEELAPNSESWDVDSLDLALRAHSSTNPGVVVGPEQPAYVYYTSGTTGVPKGVVATQANLASYLALARERYGFGASDVSPAMARFTFSISMFELMSPLTAGGTLVVLERAHVLDLGRLAETLTQVTFFHAGPSLLRSLLGYIEQHYPDFRAFSKVRHASSGGDMVPVEVLKGLRRVFHQAQVFVIYGCSEISCMGCTYEVPREGEVERTYVGVPFDGVTLRVVDEALQRVPTGVVGEVLFAGPGVVRGYLNRPSLDAERFVELEGLRYYRTGDRGRLNEQGLLELLGRSDFQVKLGGIRIELGEVEHHLRRAPGVENGVVVAKATTGGEKQLVAYFVAKNAGDAKSRAALIREHLARALPDYMVPSLYVELPALPLNHNLKVDRNALPDPPQARRSVDPATQEPRTPTQRQLVRLWREALGVEHVALDDTFFDLGGQSLSALRLIVDIRRDLGVTLSGLELLREPFGVLTALCDERSGKASAAQTDAPPAVVEDIEAFHFGSGSELFGVLYGEREREREREPRLDGEAVLICPPIGHEHLRAHFILQRLARRLASRGLPTLRFDYFGCRDSLGESGAGDFERWRRDIISAASELRRRTGARRIRALGVRLGATLLVAAAPQLGLAGVVAWDPVTHGARYLADLRAAHRRKLASATLTARVKSLVPFTPQELLGEAYSAKALKQLERLQLRFDDPKAQVRTLETGSAWLDTEHLEDMLPDTGISDTLSRLLLEAT